MRTEIDFLDVRDLACRDPGVDSTAEQTARRTCSDRLTAAGGSSVHPIRPGPIEMVARRLRCLVRVPLQDAIIGEFRCVWVVYELHTSRHRTDNWHYK